MHFTQTTSTFFPEHFEHTTQEHFEQTEFVEFLLQLTWITHF
jgi:hypothetical protein